MTDVIPLITKQVFDVIKSRIMQEIKNENIELDEISFPKGNVR